MSGDSELIRNLAQVRGADPPISSQQLRQLRYLAERLVAAAAVYGYEDLEEDIRHTIHFGEIGPEGGAAPVFLDGREVSYKLVIDNHNERPLFEFIIEGKIYNDNNSHIT